MQLITGKKYFDSVPLERINDVITRGVELYPDRTAVVYRRRPNEDPVEVTYRTFADHIAAFKEALLSLGLGDEFISLVGANAYPWLVSYLSVISEVGVICPLDAMLKGAELKNLINRSHSAALIGDAKALESLIPYLGECPEIRYWIAMNVDPDKDTKRLTAFREAVSKTDAAFFHMQELMDRGQERLATDQKSPDFPRDPQELAALIFTSGTTAAAKGVMLSNRNITADIKALQETVKFEDPLYTLSILPLHHTLENTCGFLTVLSLGGCIHICDGLRYIGDNLKEYRVHLMVAVPQLLEAIYHRIRREIRRNKKEKIFKLGLGLSKTLRFLGIDLRRKIFRSVLEGLGSNLSTVICGAAPLNADICKFFDDIGVHVLEGYGLTEASPVVAGNNTQLIVPNSCGQPLSGVTVAIDSDIPGEPGDILVKSDIVMLGYYDNPEATAEAFRDGWLVTGDVGCLDPKDHVLRLTGRTKSMIVLPSGKKIFPEELEAILDQKQFVKDSLVFAQQDEQGDVVLMAKLVLDKDELAERGMTDDDSVRKQMETYIEQLNQEVPTFKGIRSYVYSFGDMIKTTTMKIKRNVETEKLQELFEKSKLTWRDLIGKNIDRMDK